MPRYLCRICYFATPMGYIGNVLTLYLPTSAVLPDDPTGFAFDYQFGPLGAGELAASRYCVALLVVQRIRAQRSVGLHRPTTIGAWFK